MNNFASNTLTKLMAASNDHLINNERQNADFSSWNEMKSLKAMHDFFGNHNPYEAPREGHANAEISINGRKLVSYCTYNYLGLNGHESVLKGSEIAGKKYGTSASASRIAGGECRIHSILESSFADFFEVEAATTTVGGYIANVATIGFLADSDDLIIYDELCHNSIVAGCNNSSAKRLQFKHQDLEHLETLLIENRDRHRRALIVVESVYSMDGDVVNLPRLVEIRNKYEAILMVDEAHSLGVLGKTGKGIAEHYGLPCSVIDILMGTLSKSFASCGGIIMGSQSLINMLRYKAKGFHLYSAGIPPTAAGAAHAALDLMVKEPERITKLHENSQYLASQMKQHGIDVGLNDGTPIIPVMLPKNFQSNESMASLSRTLFRKGIHVIGLAFPVVPRNEARLRFFVSSNHTQTSLKETCEIVSNLIKKRI